MDRRELNELRSIEELAAYQKEVRGRLEEIDKEHEGLPFPDEVRDEYASLDSEDGEIDKRITELRARQERAAKRMKEGDTEEVRDVFQTARPGAVRGDDIWDLSSVRASVGHPEYASRELRDRAMRAVELARFPHTKREQGQEHVAGLVDRIDGSEGAVLARHLLATGSPAYKRAFGKYLANQEMSMSTDEQKAFVQARALSLTTSAGGVAVPFELDPTVIPTSNLAVNPFRAISRVEQITVDEWRGVSSAGVTAAYAAEVTEAGDNAPTLAQPTVSTEKAQAFIPFSIEIGMDWGSLQAEMGRLLQDAKDELEASAFATGSGTNAPQGVITGATATVTASTGGTFVSKDIFTVEENLPPRFRARAVWVANRAIANRIRQFDTAGGASLWVDNLRLGLDNQVPAPGNFGSALIGYPAYESTTMSSSVTTGQKILLAGDFSYYLIADRIGLSVELIPHMFATANNRPSGQRGLYAYWRNGAGVLSTNAFRILQL